MGRPRGKSNVANWDAIVAQIRVRDGHWLWTGNLNDDGYGRHCGWLAHRLVYSLLVEPLPPHVLLHHTCDERRCVNPTHVETSTWGDHPDNRPHQLAARTQCDHGHPLDGRRNRHGQPAERYCTTCERDRQRAARAVRV